MKKVCLFNLGCSKNIVDGNTIVGFLESREYEITRDPLEAGLLIVNTCTFIENATREAIDTILEAGQISEADNTHLIVAGCFSQRYATEVADQFPEVDLWLNLSDWKTDLAAFLSLDADASFHRHLEEPRHTQHLKISEGCSHRCSFCIIPHIRGDFRSVPPQKLIREAQWLDSQGVQECIVVSQDTSFYGRDIQTSLAQLLTTLIENTAIPYFRMMYLHPAFVDEALLDTVARQERICSYFDIPLQHISDAILSDMGRKPLSEGIYRLISRIRRRIPEAGLRTSFIVGYPGETEDDFQQLCDFVKWARFDKLGVFPYSPEEGTRAARLPRTLSEETVQSRCEILMEIQRNISREKQEGKVGTRLPVIIDRISDTPDFTYEARTLLDAPEVDGRVFIAEGDGEIGTIHEAEIIDCDDYDLFARLI
jgi:ribosomal protein S12 methylthiotransferase